MRSWFRAADGTYYRNLPLIMSELRRTVLPWRRRKLRREFDQVFSLGLIRKAALERGDVVVEPVSFREAYPQHPALWRLDEVAP